MSKIRVYPVVPREDLSKEQLDHWKAELMREIRLAMMERDEREEQWEISVAQYSSRMERKDAGARDAKLDFSTSFELSEQNKAHLINPILGYPQMFYPRSRARDFFDVAKAHEDLSDWMADPPQEDWVTRLDEILTQAHVFGSVWAKTSFVRETTMARYWDMSSGEPVEKVKEVVLYEGPRTRIVHTPHMLWPEDAGDDVHKLPWIAEMYFEDFSKVKEREKVGEYESGFVAEQGDDVGPNKALIPGGSKDRVAGSRNLLELYEVYARLPTGEEVIATIDMRRQRWGRLVYNPNHTIPRPYDNWAWKAKVGTVDGTSLMQLLEAPHRAYAAIINMHLDSGSRALEPLLIVLKELGLGEQLSIQGRPESGLIEIDRATADELKNGIREFRLSENFTSLQWVLERIVAHMHNIASIPQAMFGVEMADRPTAHGTSTLLNEARQPLSFVMERFRRFLGNIQTHKYAVLRQHWPEGVNYYLRSKDAQEQSVLWQSMQWPDGVWQQQIVFELSCSSERMSRDARRQQLLGLAEQVPALLKSVMEFAQPAMSGDPIAMLAAQAAVVQADLVQDILKEFDVAGADGLDVRQGINVGAQYQQTVQTLQAQLGQAQRQLAQVVGFPQGGPPGGPGGGAPGAGAAPQVPGMAGGQPMPGRAA